MLSVLATVVPVWLVGLAHGGAGPTSSDVATAAARRHLRSPEARALAVLHRWDRRRALAWAAADPSALGRLYVPGSVTGARDVGDLRRWIRRGVRVVGLEQQVAAFRVTDRDRHRLVVTVTDRTVDGVAVRPRRRVAIPASGWTTHRIRMLRGHARWRVAEVRAQPAR